MILLGIACVLWCVVSAGISGRAQVEGLAALLCVGTILLIL